MRARAVRGVTGGTRHSRLLIALVAGALLTMASAACGGAAPAAMTGGPAPTAVSTDWRAPTAVPSAVPAPGSTAPLTPGPITWDVLQGPGRLSDVISTGSLLVAVGMAGTTPEGDTAGVWTSPDGRTWEPAKVTRPAGTMAAVAAVPGRLVAVGTVEDGTSGPAAWTSVDGRTWQALPASAFAGSAGHEPGALEDVAAGPGGFVVVGSENGPGGNRATAWHSVDGLTWTRTESDLGGDSAGAVVQFGPGYVAAGWAPGVDGDDRALFWTSSDGRTWAAAPDAKDLHDVGSTPILAAAAQHLVAFGSRSHQWVSTEPIVWTSQDGVTWIREAAAGVVAPLPTVSPAASDQLAVTGLAIGGLIGTDGAFVAAGEAISLGRSSGTGPVMGRRVIWTSSTGATWCLVADLPEGQRDPGSDPAVVGPLVAHRGRLLVFGIPQGAGPAPLWETDLQGVLDMGR
jgi:hypothetical protein